MEKPVLLPAGSTHAFKPLEPIGVTKLNVDRTDMRMVKALRQVPSIKLMPMDVVKKVLKSRKGMKLILCGAELDCMVEFGRMLGVKQVISGDMSMLGNGYVLSLKVVEVSSSTITQRVSVVITGTQVQQDQKLEEAAFQLLAPDLFTGFCKISVDVKGASIFLDGRMVATSPAKVLTTTVGAHNLRVTHPAYHDFLRFVNVSFRKTVELSVNLKAFPIIAAKVEAKGVKPLRPKIPKQKVIYRPLPWYRKWYVVTAISVGALLLVGAVTTTAVALTRRGDLDWDLSTHIRH